MAFSIPMSHSISNVFPLPEGLLIETKSLKPISKESLKKELLNQSQKSEDSPVDFQFSYFSLNFHPLNQLYSVRISNDHSVQEGGFRRESISKNIGFSPKVNVISSEFTSDLQFINSTVIPI